VLCGEQTGVTPPEKEFQDLIKKHVEGTDADFFRTLSVDHDVVDIDKKALLRSIMSSVLRTLGSHGDSVNCVATLKVGLASRSKDLIDLVVTGSADSTLKIWDPLVKSDLDTCVATLTGHTGSVTSVVVVKDSKGNDLIVSGSLDGTTRLWDPESGDELVHYRMFWMHKASLLWSHRQVHSLTALQPRTMTTKRPAWSNMTLNGSDKVYVDGNFAKVCCTLLLLV
jgi:WD40 repeat protein